MAFFKKYSLETYACFFCVFWITISCLSTTPVCSLLKSEDGDLWFRSLFFGGTMFRTIFFIFYIYLYIKLFTWLHHLVSMKISRCLTPFNTNIKKFLFSFFYITVIFFFLTLLLLFVGKQSSIASTQAQIIAASERYMNMDRAFAHTDPRLWIINKVTLTGWDFVLTYIYKKLQWIFALVLVALLLIQKQLLRKYIFAFFLAPMLALPMWLALPAITPNEMYRNNMFHIPAINVIQKEYEQTPLGYYLHTFMDLIEEHIENPQQKYPLISTNPSMHVCWGFLITYFAILLWRPLGLLFIPWFLLTCVSTLYTFQHYLIDIPTGILCAIITIILTNYLFSYEKKYYIGQHDALYFLDILQSDIKKWASLLTTVFSKRISFLKIRRIRYE